MCSMYSYLDAFSLIRILIAYFTIIIGDLSSFLKCVVLYLIVVIPIRDCGGQSGKKIRQYSSLSCYIMWCTILYTSQIVIDFGLIYLYCTIYKQLQWFGLKYTTCFISYYLFNYLILITYTFLLYKHYIIHCKDVRPSISESFLYGRNWVLSYILFLLSNTGLPNF